MKETNRPVTDFLIVDVCRVTRGVKGQVGCELNVCWTMQALEPLETCVEGHTAPSGKPHDANARWVDARVLGQQLECAVGVVDHRELPKLPLICYRVHNPARREAI